MNLVADIGNTRVKAGIFDGDQLLHTLDASDTMELSKQVLSSGYTVNHIFTSSVRTENPADLQPLESIAPVQQLSLQMKLPFKNSYRSNRLGQDRIAAAAGAVSRFPGEDLLIIDAGTCITRDFVSADGTYLGGSISPGIRMRYKAMHNFTGRLPFPESTTLPVAITGDDTEASLHSGVLNGVIFETEGFIQSYRENHPGLKVLLTGGDSKILAGALKNSIFTDPFLVLKGLNKILTLNVAD